MDTILQFDHTLIFYVHDHLVYSFLTPIMAFLSKITGSGILWIIIALLLMIQKKYRVLGIAIIIALGFVFIIGDQGLKPHIARLRPFVDFPEVTVPSISALPLANTYSFPSGHTFGSFASAMTIYLGARSNRASEAIFRNYSINWIINRRIFKSLSVCTLSDRCINQFSIRHHCRMYSLEARTNRLGLVD